MSKLPLTNLILGLRQELQQAQEQAKNQDIAFEVQEIELEVLVTTESSGSGHASVKFFALEFGIKGDQKDVLAHKIKLKLKPQLNQIDDDKGPTRVLVNAEGKK